MLKKAQGLDLPHVPRLSAPLASECYPLKMTLRISRRHKNYTLESRSADGPHPPPNPGFFCGTPHKAQRTQVESNASLVFSGGFTWGFRGAQLCTQEPLPWP